ncbi:MAG TPA: glycosyltransferase family 4 protein [Chloroflexota bacterium]
MRVVYLSRRYPPSIGGMQRLSRELHLALQARVPTRAVCWAGSQRLLPLVAPLAALRAATWLLCWPDGPARERPGRGDEVLLAGDAVLAPIALALGRALGCPVAAIAHGLDFLYPSPLLQAVVPAALRRLDLAIAISAHVRDRLLAGGLEPSRCLAIPPAVEPDPLPTRAAARARLSRRLGLDLGERPLLTRVDRLVARKGVAWFVRECMPGVLAARPDALLVVGGAGPELAAIEAAAAALPAGSAFLLGQVDDPTRADLYAGADLFVMPNRPRAGDAEGFGLAAAQAAWAGLPVVATALEGIAEAVVEGLTGRLVRPDDPAAFADAVIRLLDDPAERARLAAAARVEAASRFSWAAVGDRYAEALAGLVDPDRPLHAKARG